MSRAGYRIRFSLGLIAVVLLMGTFGYHWIEGWTLFESFYMTVITVSTVGFREVQSLHGAGRILTILVIVLGVSGAATGVSGIMEEVVETRIRRLMGRRRLEKRIKKLNNHVIVCGYGRMGSILAQELKELGETFVVIELRQELTAQCDRSSYHYILGDAREESVLKEAGVDRARAVVTVLASDADNILVTLTARGLNDRASIISRCEEPEKEKSFLRAGASKVITPQAIGAKRAAYALVKPHVSDFIDVATEYGDLELVIDQMELGNDSAFVGHSLRESELRKKTGFIVLAIRRNGEMLFNPPPDSVLKAGDTLVTVGKQPEGHLRA